jgi:hypothetical protein
MTFLWILASILALIVVVSVCLHISSRPRVPSIASTPSAGGTAGTTSFLAVLGGIRDKGWPFIVILLALWTWYMTSNDFSKKAGTTFFVVGLIIIALNLLVLGVSAPFEQNKLRKLSYVGFWVVGIFFLARGAGLDWESFTSKMNTLNTSTSASTGISELIPERTSSVEINPNKWSKEVLLTPGAKFRIKAPAGKLKFLFRNGYVVSVNNRNDEDVELNNIPDVVFRMSGSTGVAKVIIYKKG